MSDPNAKPKRTFAEQLKHSLSWRYNRLRKKVFSDEVYTREKSAVRAGISKYQGEVGTGRELYLLRRHIHGLEKGLTMRPRRSEFGLATIERTMSSFEALVRRGEIGRDTAEFNWMYSVLSEYFDATSGSENPLLVKMRGRFATFESLAAEVEPTNGPHPHALGDPAVDIAALERLAQDRRSVRWFLPKPVPREVVDRAVLIAAESPTACNRQPYRFEIFDDPEAIAKVAEIPMGTRGFAHGLQGLIVVVGDLSAFYDNRDRHLIYVDGCLASMGLIYGLEAQGVASCTINWPDLLEREKAMRKLLGLASYERVIMLLAYGYADPEGLVPFSAKRQIDEIRRFASV